jgi:glyoxylate/hydroxypyruvate reductase A
MALLFLSDIDPPKAWVPALQAALPGLEVRVWPDIGNPADIAYALVWSPPPGLLAGLPNLKAVFSLGAGLDHLFRDPALPAHVPVVRMVDPGLTQGMTEYVALHVLAWHRQAAAYRAQQARAEWRALRQPLAPARRVGVLGLGMMGGAAARALAGLGFAVAGWSRTPRAEPGIESVHGADAVAPFLDRSEILVCLLPLTPETAGILNAETFARLPRGAYLINAGRGGHLVEADLLAALDTGQIAGAALDVFAEEPLAPDHPFWHHPAVTVTPHVAGTARPRTAAPVIAEAIRRIEAGEPPPHVVDRVRGY